MCAFRRGHPGSRLQAGWWLEESYRTTESRWPGAGWPAFRSGLPMGAGKARRLASQTGSPRVPDVTAHTHTMASVFTSPLRYIFDISDLAAFSRSLAHSELVAFVAALNTACRGKGNVAASPNSSGGCSGSVGGEENGRSATLGAKVRAPWLRWAARASILAAHACALTRHPPALFPLLADHCCSAARPRDAVFLGG